MATRCSDCPTPPGQTCIQCPLGMHTFTGRLYEKLEDIDNGVHACNERLAALDVHVEDLREEVNGIRTRLREIEKETAISKGRMTALAAGAGGTLGGLVALLKSWFE